MSKKAEQTEKKLLQCAKDEFLEKGFLGANVRSIAQRAGMTTGAIYRYYEDKNAMFEAIMKPVLDEFDVLFQEASSVQSELLDNNELESRMPVASRRLLEFVDYMYQRFDEFDMLVNGSAGSSLENFAEKWIEADIEATRLYMEKLVAMGLLRNDPSMRVIAIFVKQGYWAILEVVASRMTYEEAMDYMRYLIPFLHAGWKTLLEEGEETAPN
ncbi:TetR/AcrR family transcriptional regulator [Paenibacillus paeoniae]|uniref:TetR/AcrR family transcriptional regulator n=1 Tax=Paenibacillus paeoniae TaxID=2292705 RepID=A0A371PFZ6_9BACL|nr:TetR/AcrR family transcriptional regulator [Paenibacillus paeoniae]REK74784.1 TetR/AcrR family transcriptional regulator [Paenibacillus paeoniae]